MEAERATLTDEYCLALTPTSTASLRARDAVLRDFERLRDEARWNLAKVVESLVASAVARGPGKAITVTLSMSDYSIRGEVAGSAGPRTNALLERLCSRWAIYEGTTDVWFEISLVSPLTHVQGTDADTHGRGLHRDGEAHEGRGVDRLLPRAHAHNDRGWARS